MDSSGCGFSSTWPGGVGGFGGRFTLGARSALNQKMLRISTMTVSVTISGLRDGVERLETMPDINQRFSERPLPIITVRVALAGRRA